MTEVGGPDERLSVAYRLVRYLRYRVSNDYALNTFLWVAVLIAALSNAIRFGVSAEWGQALLLFAVAVVAVVYVALPYLAWVASQHLRGQESATRAKRVGSRKPRWVVEGNPRS